MRHALGLYLRIFLEEVGVHQLIVVRYHFEHVLLVGLNDVAADDHLFEDEVSLMEIEDEVELAHITEVLVEDLDEVMNNVEYNQFVVFLFYACYEVQRRIALKHDFVVAPLQEMGQLAAATDDHCADLHEREQILEPSYLFNLESTYLALYILTLLLREMLVVLVHTRLAMTTYEQHKVDHICLCPVV